MADYNDTAIEILRKSIKSVILIDENAKEPYSEVEHPDEEERTIALYRNFRDMGISMDVWQYKKEQYHAMKSYIYDNRDLILLDWKLEGDGNSGEKALEILSDMVKHHGQVHFCVIYTNERTTDVLLDLLSYFSSLTTADSDKISLALASYEDAIAGFFDLLTELNLCRFDRKKSREITKKVFAQNKESAMFICEYFKNEYAIESPQCAFIKAGIGLGKHAKSQILQPCPSAIDLHTQTIYIGTTFITVLSKKDVDPAQLFSKFSETIANNENGTLQLLGLEYRNILREKGQLVNGEVTNISKTAFGYHKKSSSEDFESFLKTIMLENDALKIRPERLSIIEAIEDAEFKEELQQQYAYLNVFYDSNVLDGDRELFFGDVFKCGEDYYLCITALCDCVRPQKRKNRYYFVQGRSLKMEEAIKIGDEGFISFLPPAQCVQWTDKRDMDEITPTYIVPEILIVPDNVIRASLLHATRMYSEAGIIRQEALDLKYITTLKHQYAQRIANHAFTHPVRVGVDFVKKPRENREL